MDTMSRGSKNRVTKATASNAESSRSHSLFTIFVEASFNTNGNESITAGKLNLVDLAGSERIAKT